MNIKEINIKSLDKKETQKIIADLYVNAVLNEPTETIVGSYKRDGNAYVNYANAIAILIQMKKKGKLDFSCDPMDKPCIVHQIVINWKGEDGYIELDDTKEISEFLSKIDSIHLNQKDGSEWILYSTIYTKEEEDNV